jgi:uroporphyrinogen-III decarboxylase
LTDAASIPYCSTTLKRKSEDKLMVELDLDKYDLQVREARLLYDKTLRFEEPPRVPIAISTGAPYYCHLFNVNLRDYYTDLDCQLDVQLRAIKWNFEVLHDDREGYEIRLDIGIIKEGLFFDCEIARPDDSTPWAIPRIETPRDIEALVVPEVETHPKVQDFYRKLEILRSKVEHMGLNIPVSGSFTIHPPLSAACAVANPTLVYFLMAVEPDMVKLLLRKMYEAFCRLQDYYDKVTGTKTTRLYLADDNSAFISNEMYREFVYDYNLALYKKYGTEYRYLHADGPNDHHFAMYANEFRLNRMDAGGFSNIEIAKRDLGGKVAFSGGLNGRELYFRDLEEAKPAICQALRICAPGGGYIFAIGGETMPGIPETTLVDMVSFTKEVGRYPIDPSVLGTS